MPKLTPRQRAYVKKKSKYEELDPSEMMGELNIVPFLDIVMNLIMFLLATSEAVLLISQIELNTPSIAKGGKPKSDEVQTPLNLTVILTDKGAIVSGSGGTLAPGCEGAGQDKLTVPLKGKDYDWPGLTKCVAKVKKTFEDETSVKVGADPQIEYEHLIAAMDAVRKQGEDELFPDVMVQVGIR